MASIAILIRYLKAGLLLHDYVLHPQEACWVKCWQNERLSGAAEESDYVFLEEIEGNDLNIEL